MKVLYRLDVEVKTTKKGEKLQHEVTSNPYELLKIQTEHYVDQVKDFHTEEFNKGKRKSLVTRLKITITG